MARYVFDIDGWRSNVQATYAYQGSSTPTLKVANAQALGSQPAYGTFDLSAGGQRHGVSLDLFVTNLFDTRGQLTRFAECDPIAACKQTYIIPTQPRTIGFKVGQSF